MKPHNRVGFLIWLSACMALLSYASSWFYPRKTFRLFVWGVENIPLMHWLFPLLPMGARLAPLGFALGACRAQRRACFQACHLSFAFSTGLFRG